MARFKLSGRDHEILDLLAQGKRDKQIAAYMEVSEPTLRTAIRRVVNSLGAKTRCEAIVNYIRGPKDWSD
jgi:DNA-binding NarL/FixJ family response regulator